MASYQRNLATATAEFAEVETVRLPTERVFGNNLVALLAQRRVYRQLAARSAGADGVVLDYTDTFWNGSRLGENLFPSFARRLRAPTVLILHEGPGRTDPADISGPFPVKAGKRLVHLALAARDAHSRYYDDFVREKLFSFAAHMVTHSRPLAQSRSKDLPVARVHVLPTPTYTLPASAWSTTEIESRFGLSGKRVAVLLGFPQPSKGFDRAVTCLPHLPADVVFLQVGTSDRSRAQCEALTAHAAALGAGDRFIRAGYLTDPELAAVLRRADVAVAPFRAVHHSSSLGHLIAFGIPIVAADIPSTRELAADGAGLVFADCDDPKALADVVTAVVSDRAFAEELRTLNDTYTRAHGFRSVARFVCGLFGPTTPVLGRAESGVEVPVASGSVS
ncbi:Glycosyltransferase [Fimbriiglobus ruber]|uniref:Glycosyltransferase n=1 Tax=Fimbriiglobus ruber TaxID=1908690 RepID=A0A225DS68_9BACT|nr:Glycosyltransferase [Fimbriiglobus ruber]